MLFNTDAMLFVPNVYLVDDDIDPTSIKDVVWALATRTHPTGRRAVFENQPIVRLPQCYLEEEYQARRGPKVVFDTLLPEDRPAHASFEQGYPQAVRERVLDNWPSA